MSLDNFFNPNSIVVIGASSTPGKVGNTLVKRLSGFKGMLFLVNKEGHIIYGIKSYRRLTEIHHIIDLAIIAVPGKFVGEIMRECAQKNIFNVIIISSNLTDFMKEEIKSIARKHKINFIGPNCFGVVNTANYLDTTFASSPPLAGGVSFISQSGAIWSGIVELGLKYNLGFSKFVSLGDMEDLGFHEFIRYLENDKNTKVILLYIEGLKDGEALLKSLSDSKKPVVVVKGGRFGVEAVKSHTGSLAGNYDVYKAVLKDKGCYFVDSLFEGLNLCRFLVHNKFEGKKTVIISNAGGPGVLLNDYLVMNGLELSNVTDFKFDFEWSGSNPMDLWGDARIEKFDIAFKRLIKFKDCDNVVLILTPQDMTDVKAICEKFVEFKQKSRKVCIGCLMGSVATETGHLLLEKNGIVCFDRLEDVAGVLRFTQS